MLDLSALVAIGVVGAIGGAFADYRDRLDREHGPDWEPESVRMNRDFIRRVRKRVALSRRRSSR